MKTTKAREKREMQRRTCTIPEPEIDKGSTVILEIGNIESRLIYWGQLSSLVSFQERVFTFVRNEVITDQEYIPHRCTHGHYQAGKVSFGDKFGYKRKEWAKREIPDVLIEIKEVVQSLIDNVCKKIGTQFNVVLVHVYSKGDKLAMHQDVDGTPQTVACVTFDNQPNPTRRLEFFTKSRKMVCSLLPTSGSLWFMSGYINSRFKHWVTTEDVSGEDSEDSIRVSITFRQVSE